MSGGELSMTEIKKSPEVQATLLRILELYGFKPGIDANELLMRILTDMVEIVYADNLLFRERWKNRYARLHVFSSKSNGQDALQEKPKRKRKKKDKTKTGTSNGTKIPEVEQEIIKLYTEGINVREISERIRKSFDHPSPNELTDRVTGRVIWHYDEWKRRRLDKVYVGVFLDVVSFNVHMDGFNRKMYVYFVVGINNEGFKDILSYEICEVECEEFWLMILKDLKSRGVEDIFILCAYGATDIEKALEAIFPHTELQQCLSHKIRITQQQLTTNMRKQLAADMRVVYQAADEQAAYEKMQAFIDKRYKDQTRVVNQWLDDWENIRPIYKYSYDVRRALYSDSPLADFFIKVINSYQKKIVFTAVDELMKILYLFIQQEIENAKPRVSKWEDAYVGFRAYFGGRLI